eukprot:TRINITY_DN64126_c0_g1_i1.p1 TRINITY_DN64126_c0_g1~~TRINITY_DN64126_c0_g1_i1.p1  ORF type:complete len:471 (+),score=89.42 TRINITY_DN64126_c0_g1_i1:74-1486(+)
MSPPEGGFAKGDFCSGSTGGTDYGSVNALPDIETDQEKGEPPNEVFNQATKAVPLLARLGPVLRAHTGDKLFSAGEDEPCLLDSSDGSTDKSSTPMVALAILKSFIGPGVTFLPGAFSKGGLVFSSVSILIVGFLNAVSVRILLDCREQSNMPSLPAIAYAASGTVGQTATQISVVLSQFGICMAQIVFMTRMAAALQLGHPAVFVAALLSVLVPLSFIRSLHKLEGPNLVADVLILTGLGIAIFYFLQGCIESGGVMHNIEVTPKFKPETAGVFLGTAIYVFEGIPMILPVRESMKDPRQFWSLFKAVFTFIVVFFALFGFIGYVAAGEEVHTTVLEDLPDLPPAQFARGAYIVALTFGFPLMFLPAARITELWVFGESSKLDSVWWKVNCLRAFEVLLLAAPVLGKPELFDQLLAIIGAVCAGPVAFVYPPLFHLILCETGSFAKAVDMSLIVLGLLIAFFALADVFD